MSAKITFGKKVTAGGDAFIGTNQAVKIVGAESGTSPVIPEIRAAGQQVSSKNGSEIAFADELHATGDLFAGAGNAVKVSYQEKSEHRDPASATQSRTGRTIAEARDGCETNRQGNRTFSSEEPRPSGAT